MNVFRWLTDGFDYIFEAAVRIFSPSDDAYPVIGMQPYEGDAYSSGWT